MRHTIAFIVILTIASLLRLWQLDSIPTGLHPDEAGIGYAAYSFLHTGRSPFGDTSIFAIQEGWGGSRPPLYIYSVIPSVAIFGLTQFAVRLPSAIYGILSVGVFFFLLKYFFRSNRIATIGGFLFAINPWAIHISRQGLLEAISLFFVLLGTYIFVIAKKQIVYYILSVLLYGASMYAYDAPKIFLPPFIVILIVLYQKILFRIPKTLGLFFVLFLLIYGSMLQTTFFNKQIKDFQQVSIIRWSEISAQVNMERTQTTAPLWLSRFYHNKATVAGKKILTSYMHVFSPNFLFINGYGNIQESTARQGMFYVFELPLFFMGLSSVLMGINPGILFIWWMIFGALPGGFTSENYPYRSVLLLPAVAIFSSLGLSITIDKIRHMKRLPRFFVIGVFSIVMATTIASYLFTYFIDYPVYASEWWGKQRNDVIRYVIQNKTNYSKVYINGNWEIMYAFFSHTNPNNIRQTEMNPTMYKNISVKTVDNVVFGNFTNVLLHTSTPSAFFPPKSLIVVEGNMLKSIQPKQIFPDPGGVRVIYKIIEVN